MLNWISFCSLFNQHRTPHGDSAFYTKDEFSPLQLILSRNTLRHTQRSASLMNVLGVFRSNQVYKLNHYIEHYSRSGSLTQAPASIKLFETEMCDHMKHWPLAQETAQEHSEQATMQMLTEAPFTTTPKWRYSTHSSTHH